MSQNRSDTSEQMPDTGGREPDQADKPSAKAKSTARQERLAAQLRENLKKRKALRRARQTGDDSAE